MNDFAEALLRDEEWLRKSSTLRAIRHRIPELDVLARGCPDRPDYARKARLLRIEEAQLARDLVSLAARIQRRIWKGDN